jgi:uncharacterized membrane protein YphA (DoxX/SURF4 family)
MRMRATGLARGVFAIAVASVAILSLSYGDFVPRGQPFPTWIAWRETWIYTSALLLLAASAGLCFSRTALPSALMLSAYETLWALICALPILSKPLDVGSWYGFCEALAQLIGAWILYTMLRQPSRETRLPIAGQRGMHVARVVFGLTCVFYGWSHFAYAQYTASMVPVWLPGRLGFAYLTGLGHIAAGLGMAVGVLPRLAATLETIMMTLFGRATPTENQWSELVVNVVLAACAWMVAISLQDRPWGRIRPSSG